MISIMVRVPNWLGDCVMCLPVFREIRKAFPSAHIIAAARENVAELFRASQNVDDIVITPPATAGILSIWKDARQLRDRNISFGILLTNSFGTALWMTIAGVKKRIGFSRDLRGVLLNCPFKPTPEILAAHQAAYYLHLLKGIGIDATLSTPSFEATPQQQKEAGNLLREIGIESSFAVLAPFSAYGAVKDWPLDYYRQTAETLAGRGLDVLVTGTGSQQEQCAALCGNHPRLHNVAGKTGLGGFIGLLSGTTIFVGGDSGGAHLSAALGRPTISIFGITEPSRTRALGPKVEIIGNGGLVTPNLRDPAVAQAARNALAALSAAEVLAAVDKLLA